MMGHVRFAARDPGGANVLVGFLMRCQPDVPFTIDCWSMPRSTPVFQRAGFDFREFDDVSDTELLRAIWMERPADALVTGTSHQGFSPKLWTIARAEKCPSLAVLDAWVNLAPRFQEQRPDYVGAIDETQAEELVKLGFAREQIFLTGHPWLSEVVRRRDEIIATTRPQEFGEGLRVLFCSEPCARDVAAGINAPFGFTEIDSFNVLYRAACTAVREGTRIALAVKFHPYDEPADFIQHLSTLQPPPGLTLHAIPHADKPHPWVLWSDLAVGIGSIILLESVILGKPIISVQPNLIREDTLILSQLGFARRLSDPAEGERELVTLLKSRAAREAEYQRNKPFFNRFPTDSFTPILLWILEHGSKPRP